MFYIQNIRETISKRLQDLGVFYPYTEGVIEITETANDTTELRKVTLNNMPTENLWVFENEFGHLKQNQGGEIGKQKDAFVSAGKKVEKTIIFLDNSKIFLFMLEMKTTLHTDLLGGENSIMLKYANSINHLSIYLASHSFFSTLEQCEVVPVGICCYNFDECVGKKMGTDEWRKARQKAKKSDTFRQFLENYIEKEKKEFHVEINPLLFGKKPLPVFFYPNPNTPITESFDIDFQDFFTKLREI